MGGVCMTMETTNLGENDGLRLIEWSQVEQQVEDLLMRATRTRRTVQRSG